MKFVLAGRSVLLCSSLLPEGFIYHDDFILFQNLNHLSTRQQRKTPV